MTLAIRPPQFEALFRCLTGNDTFRARGIDDSQASCTCRTACEMSYAKKDPA